MKRSRYRVFGTWNHLYARPELQSKQEELALTDLTLEPILDIHRLQIDVSGSEQGKYLLTLDGKAFGSSLAATASYLQPAEKASIDLALKLLGLDLGQIQKQWPIPVSGSIPKIDVQLSTAKWIAQAACPRRSPRWSTGSGINTTPLTLPELR